jgi:general stress protein YciG
MAGTVIGGKSAAKTNKERHGESFYADIGRIGGKKSRLGGWASEKVGKDGLTGRERASIAGRKGGLKSRKPKSSQ